MRNWRIWGVGVMVLVAVLVVAATGCEDGDLPPVPEGYKTPEGVVITTATVTPAPVQTETPTTTPMPTATPVPTATDTPKPTATDTPMPTATDTPAPTVCPQMNAAYSEDLFQSIGELEGNLASVKLNYQVSEVLGDANSMYISATAISVPNGLEELHAMYLQALSDYAQYANHRLMGNKQRALSSLEQARSKMRQFEDAIWELDKNCSIFEYNSLVQQFLRYHIISRNMKSAIYDYDYE